jgi:septum formation protein
MLRRLQGDTHEVFTGLAVGWVDGGLRLESLVDMSKVSMLPMTDDEIAWYVGTGEPLDKAGGYALQGIGGMFVSKVVGSPSTVVGLPVHLLGRLIAKSGVDVTRFRKRAGG